MNMLSNLGPLLCDSTFLNSNLDITNFNVCHFNAQSIAPKNSSEKLQEIRHLFNNCKYDVIGISETWLKNYITSTGISINGFQMVRNDRNWMRGGGVCLYVSKKLKVKVIDNFMNEGNIETLFVEISLGKNNKILVGVIYLPHGNFSGCEALIMDLTGRYNNCIIMGDFNTDIYTKSHIVRDFCSRSNLNIIHNCIPTHINVFHNTSTLIDYFFVSNRDLVIQKTQYQFPPLN